MKRKGLILLSGGLDSTLAAKMILEQGVELEAVNFTSLFYASSKKVGKGGVEKAAENLGISLKTVDMTEDHLEIIKNPKHGYGSNMNPCIDCRIFMLRKAKEYMDRISASFIITGEVLGERPMSQRRDMIRHIEKESGLDGLVVRPLSAKLFEPSIPEDEGAVDRERLFDIRGRSRKPQIDLARKFGIEDYPAPAGGCLLTDPGFSKRVKDLLEHDAFTLENIQLLKLGRHFRLSPKLKLVVGRNKDENNQLLDLALGGNIFFDAKGIPGPIGLLKGRDITRNILESSAGIVLRYSDTNDRRVAVIYWRHPEERRNEVVVAPATEESLRDIRI